MRINGSGKFTRSKTVMPGGMLLRVDDQRDPAFWLEVFLSEADLRGEPDKQAQAKEDIEALKKGQRRAN